MTLPDLIYCAGGNERFAGVALSTGFRYGARLPCTTYGPVYFADQQWKNPDRQRYMAALAEHKPQMATVLDWEREEQLGEVLDWAEEAIQYASCVVIIPKVMGGIDKLPKTISGKQVVLGYSVPTKHGATELPLWEFAGWPVHLLGGSPQKQMRLFLQFSCSDVVSVDGNMTNLMAHKGKFWQSKKIEGDHWIHLSVSGDTDRHDANLRAFRLSCVNIMEAWQTL